MSSGNTPVLKDVAKKASNCSHCFCYTSNKKMKEKEDGIRMFLLGHLREGEIPGDLLA